MKKNKTGKNYTNRRNSGIKIFAAAVIVLFSLQNLYAVYDHEYIENYRQKLAVKTYLSKSLTTLTFRDKSGSDYQYSPNTPATLGIGASWGGLTLSGGYGFDFFKDKDKGDTESLDVQGYYYKRNFAISFFLQKYGGFYMKDGNNEDADFIRQDIKVTRMGFFMDYLFSGEKFSYSASFSQKEKQLRSAGSFQAGGGVYYDIVSADKSFVSGIDDDKKNNISNVQFGPSMGYAYTFLLRQNFFITTAISLGANVGIGIVNSSKVRAKIYPLIIPRFAMGYSKENWAINMTYAYNETNIMDFDEQKVMLGSGKFMLTYSRRFNFNPNMPQKYRRIFFKNPAGEETIQDVPVKPVK